MWELLREYWVPVSIAILGAIGWLAYRLSAAMGDAVKSEEDSDRH